MMNQYWPFSGLTRPAALRDRLIVSLDFGGPREALSLVDELSRVVRNFKVGRLLYRNGGPDFIRELRRRGIEVFLDLKFHDTASSMCKLAVEACRLGVRMFDLHPGSRDAMERVRSEVNRVCRGEGLRRPLILAVAMLAGLNHHESSAGAQGRVVRLGRQAADAALDGVLTYAAETAALRSACGRRFLIVSSGFGAQPGWNGWSEAAGPAETIRIGADYLVIGALVWRAAEPVQAVRELLEEMERGLRSAPRSPLELFSSRPI
jgi:orotidine-5'-phosphate decarboxylase